jgi:tetratricopeptide (TPR) repeat protein
MISSLRPLALLLISTVALSACRSRDVHLTPAAPAISRSCAAALAASDDPDIARAQAAARGGPHERQALEQLGHVYVARARVRNDAGHYKLAEMTADCLESKHPGDAAALLLKGHVLHQLHRFHEAEQIARVLVTKREFVLDYGLLGDALMEQGRLGEAATAYQKMIDLKPFYQSYTRGAHLRWLKGDVDGAIELMRLAIEAANSRDTESVAWAWTRLAVYQLQTNRTRDAAQSIDNALAQQPDYAAALLARGRILLAARHPSDAIEVLRRAARLNPLPEYQWILADALRLDGREDEAVSVEKTLIAHGAAADPRTFALFLATRRTDPAQAIALAEDELRTRADVFTLDAYAWALAANGRTADAVTAIQRALAEGTEDARLFLHAGVISAAAGRARDAKRWLGKARAMDSTLLPSESIQLAQHVTPRRAPRVPAP